MRPDSNRALKKGLEGIVSKRLGSRYRSGCSPDWLKFKNPEAPAANAGADKDSDRRQREPIASFAKRAGYDLVAEFYDAAASGADAMDSRPGFAAMLERIEGNGVRTVIVATASRFAR